VEPGGERASRDAVPLAGLDDAAWPVYTVGQAAQLLGVQPAFLRRLDTHGVVQPARSGAGQRRYSRTQITQIRHVADLAGEGFTLQAIRRLLELEGQVNELRRQLAAEQARSRHREQHEAAHCAGRARPPDRQEEQGCPSWSFWKPGSSRTS
jgi:MerR family transcriptional regulator, heat shock protein HspR